MTTSSSPAPSPAGAAARRDAYGPLTRAWHGLVLAIVVAIGAYMPHAAFEVMPWPTGNAGPRVAGTNSHTPSVVAVVAPADALEEQVRADVYKWCGFCHTMTKDGEHKLGPNLYGVYGQRAGTTPNFINYSDAMIAARDRGLVWDDAALDAYVHDPETFMPGTNMMISIGAIDDPEVRKRIVNLLKKDTNGDLIQTQGSTP